VSSRAAPRSTVAPAARSSSTAQADVDAVFGALGDATRRGLLRAVVEQGPVTASSLAASLPITRQAVTKHLRVLLDAGLVEVERNGREARYSARQDALAPASRWIDDTAAAWSRRLDRLRRTVEG
jgi:DNA-binding transcriptional ArsR family regulator